MGSGPMGHGSIRLGVQGSICPVVSGVNGFMGLGVSGSKGLGVQGVSGVNRSMGSWV